MDVAITLVTSGQRVCQVTPKTSLLAEQSQALYLLVNHPTPPDTLHSDNRQVTAASPRLIPRAKLLHPPHMSTWLCLGASAESRDFPKTTLANPRGFVYSGLMTRYSNTISQYLGHFLMDLDDLNGDFFRISRGEFQEE